MQNPKPDSDYIIPGYNIPFNYQQIPYYIAPKGDQHSNVNPLNIVQYPFYQDMPFMQYPPSNVGHYLSTPRRKIHDTSYRLGSHHSRHSHSSEHSRHSNHQSRKRYYHHRRHYHHGSRSKGYSESRSRSNSRSRSPSNSRSRSRSPSHHRSPSRHHSPIQSQSRLDYDYARDDRKQCDRISTVVKQEQPSTKPTPQVHYYGQPFNRTIKNKKIRYSYDIQINYGRFCDIFPYNFITPETIDEIIVMMEYLKNVGRGYYCYYGNNHAQRDKCTYLHFPLIIEEQIARIIPKIFTAYGNYYYERIFGTPFDKHFSNDTFKYNIQEIYKKLEPKLKRTSNLYGISTMMNAIRGNMQPCITPIKQEVSEDVYNRNTKVKIEDVAENVDELQDKYKTMEKLTEDEIDQGESDQDESENDTSDDYNDSEDMDDSNSDLNQPTCDTDIDDTGDSGTTTNSGIIITDTGITDTGITDTRKSQKPTPKVLQDDSNIHVIDNHPEHVHEHDHDHDHDHEQSCQIVNPQHQQDKNKVHYIIDDTDFYIDISK